MRALTCWLVAVAALFGSCSVHGFVCQRSSRAGAPVWAPPRVATWSDWGRITTASAVASELTRTEQVHVKAKDRVAPKIQPLRRFLSRLVTASSRFLPRHFRRRLGHAILALYIVFAVQLHSAIAVTSGGRMGKFHYLASPSKISLLMS
jgi:hypothetical protein